MEAVRVGGSNEGGWKQRGWVEVSRRASSASLWRAERLAGASATRSALQRLTQSFSDSLGPQIRQTSPFSDSLGDAEHERRRSAR